MAAGEAVSGLPRAPAGDVESLLGATFWESVSACPLRPVRPPDIPEISVSHVNLTVREGDNAVITCNGSGSPLPDVDWMVTGLQSINTHQVGAWAWAAPGGRAPPLLSLNETQESKPETGREGRRGTVVVPSLQEGHGDVLLDVL